MLHLKHGIKLLLVFYALALGGCANLDPWREYDRLPASRSKPFEAEGLERDYSETIPSDAKHELSGSTLSLAECVAIALEHNPSTSSAWQAIRAAAAGAGEAKAEYLPQVGFTSGARRSDVPELYPKSAGTGSASIPGGTGAAAGSGTLASSVAQSVVSSVSRSIASRLTQNLLDSSGGVERPGPRNRYDATFGARCWSVQNHRMLGRRGLAMASPP